MVGMTAVITRERVATLINSARFSAADIPSKLDALRQLKKELLIDDGSKESDAGNNSVIISEFLPSLLDLLTDRSSPVRKFVTEIIGPIELKHMEFSPQVIPALVSVLKDSTPAVARQAIACGMDIFRCTLIKVAIQGLHSSELGNVLESSWAWTLKLRDEIYSIAFKPGSDGRRLLALKFVEAVVLLYTPDPSSSSEPPSDKNSAGTYEDFNISWLRGGHPTLNVGDLSLEASQSLGLLLDQLRFPSVKSLSNLTIIVLINSLSLIAKKRPSFYGRILPVLLGLDLSSFASKGVYGSGVHHALRNAFISCLKCTHPGAAPWRDRLVSALREMKAGGLAEQALEQVCLTNGSAVQKDDLSTNEDEKPLNAAVGTHQIAGRKRSGLENNTQQANDDTSGKRVKSTPSEKLTQETGEDGGKVTSSGPTTSRSEVDNGPVRQLVAMFAALVAQGEKAVGSLEILISSISADLLAEVVIANMRNLPEVSPSSEGNEEQPLGLDSPTITVESNAQLNRLSSLLKDMLPPSGVIPEKDSVICDEYIASNEPESGALDEIGAFGVTAAASDGLIATEAAPVLISQPVSSFEHVPSVMENDLSITSESVDIGNMENEIPGLDSSARDSELAETGSISSLRINTTQQEVTMLGGTSLELLPSMSTEKSDELSPKPLTAVTDVTSINSSFATFSSLPTQLVLPKMSAPVIPLEDEQKDQLQKLAFVRVIDAYKQIAVAGGSDVRFSILAYLGAEFPLEIDPWKYLQTHIFADYKSHEGHELTLRVLYRLFGEAEEDRDFFSSTTATSVYEMFLLAVAEALRDSFPATDKSLSKLLGEVPYLPNSIFKLLECLCCPGISEKEKEPLSGDRVTQGLSTVWNLIMLRPPNRNACLKIALQSAVHYLEEVRMKAIRLVANKLYPLSSISQEIEDFAKKQMLSVENFNSPAEVIGVDGSNTEVQKEYNSDKSPNEILSTSGTHKDLPSEPPQSSMSDSILSSSIAEVQRCMSLYFALCTKRHSLFRQVFVIYRSSSKAVKEAVHRQIPLLVRTMGSSPQLLEIISDPPTGSEDLLMQILHTLTDGTVPSPELVSSIRTLYDTKLKDINILIPILSYLPKEEVLQVFPHLVNGPLDKFQGALSRLVQGSSHSVPVLTPSEVLIAIHGIDPDRCGIPLKKVTDACNACFEQRHIFTQQALAKALNQLVEQIPLPLLFMRTVLQAIGAFPSLVEFIMEILSRLVSKQIWKYPKLWVGFVKCAQLTKPQSFSVLLQLPPAQLENALNKSPALRAPLVAHANQPLIRSSLPRSVLVVLGIASESQNLDQTQDTQSQTKDTGNADKGMVKSQTGTADNSDKQAENENSKESSGVS